MKKLCVFHRNASRFTSNPLIHWIVCKECQRKIRQGKLVEVLFRAAANAKIREYLK